MSANSRFLNLDTDGTLSANSDEIVPSQKAIKTYVDSNSGGSVDNKSITKNSSNQLQAVALINQRDTTSATKEWIGKKAQYDAILSKDANTRYIVTDDDETTTYVNDYHIGQIFQSVLPISSYALHLIDGSLISGSGMYEDFVNYIGGLYNDDPTASYFATEADWQTAVTTYGVCGKFVYTAAAGGSPATVRLPKVTGILEGTTDVNALGDLVEAGLPNITGELFPVVSNGTGSSNWATKSGVFSNSSGNTSGAASSGSSYAYRTINFNASSSNSIYGNSLTVQPQTIKVYYYIVIANSYQTPTGIQISQVASDLNGKADKDLANCTKPYVTETYQSGTSWYRVWSNGWCEQGGTFSSNGSSNNMQIIFLKAFTDTNYTIQCTKQLNGTYNSDYAQWSGGWVYTSSKAATSFNYILVDWSIASFNWEAKGYIA